MLLLTCTFDIHIISRGSYVGVIAVFSLCVAVESVIYRHHSLLIITISLCSSVVGQCLLHSSLYALSQYIPYMCLHLQIADLQASYERSVSEKEELTQNIEKTQARLDRAAKLTTGLADEQIRWAETVTVRYTHAPNVQYVRMCMHKHIHIRLFVLMMANK